MKLQLIKRKVTGRKMEMVRQDIDLNGVVSIAITDDVGKEFRVVNTDGDFPGIAIYTDEALLIMVKGSNSIRIRQ